MRADDPAVGVLRDAQHAVVARPDDLRRRESPPSGAWLDTGHSLGRGVILRCSAAADVDQVPADLSAVSGVETIHDPHLEPA
jgi:hypothetical protein